MKRLHLVLLLAGVLAVGSAFTGTTTKTNCSGVDQNHLYNRTSTAPTFQLVSVGGGDCDATSGKCIWADLNDNGQPETPCDDSPNGIYQ